MVSREQVYKVIRDKVKEEIRDYKTYYIDGKQGVYGDIVDYILDIIEGILVNYIEVLLCRGGSGGSLTEGVYEITKLIVNDISKSIESIIYRSMDIEDEGIRGSIDRCIWYIKGRYPYYSEVECRDKLYYDVVGIINLSDYGKVERIVYNILDYTNHIFDCKLVSI